MKKREKKSSRNESFSFFLLFFFRATMARCKYLSRNVFASLMIGIAVAAALSSVLPRTEALGSLQNLLPEGVDQAQMAKLIPLFTTALTTCGDSSTFIDAINLFTGQQEFITSATQMFNEFEKRFDQSGKDGEKTQSPMSNPYVYGALDLLTSRNMTDFIRDPNLAKLSNSLNLTCIVNYPALDKVIQENAEENIKKSKELDAGYNSLDKLSYIIQGGLLSDVGTKIVPAFVGCGGDLKSLLEFTQAIAFWIRGNRDADAKLNPKLVQSYKEGSSEIPFLKTYMEETPEEVYAAFQCAKRFQ